MKSLPPFRRFGNASDKSGLATRSSPSFRDGVNDIIGAGLRLISPDSRKWDFRNIELRSRAANFNSPRLFSPSPWIHFPVFPLVDRGIIIPRSFTFATRKLNIGQSQFSRISHFADSPQSLETRHGGKISIQPKNRKSYAMYFCRLLMIMHVVRLKNNNNYCRSFIALKHLSVLYTEKNYRLAASRNSYVLTVPLTLNKHPGKGISQEFLFSRRKERKNKLPEQRLQARRWIAIVEFRAARTDILTRLCSPPLLA